MSTNYRDTFIEVADDCPVETAEVPPARAGVPTVAAMQHELIAARPYGLTSDDVLFEVFARRNDVAASDLPASREAFFSRDQPCLRSSPLGKRYGWGVHHDADGRIAVYAVESGEYAALREDPTLTHLKAMRSRRA